MIGRLAGIVLRLTPRRRRWFVRALLRYLRRRPWYWPGAVRDLRKGYYPEVLALYRDVDLHLCLSERARETRSGHINGDAAVFLNDKIAFHHAMQGVPSLRPELLAIITNGIAVIPSGETRPLADIASAHGSIVVRPVRGRKGMGLSFVDARDQGRYAINGREASRADIDALQRSAHYHLVTRFLEQHSYAAAIFPHAVNTIRLLTMRDPDSGEPFIAAALHRFGTSSSGPMDNFSRGGVSVAIDLANGRLGLGVTNPQGGALVWRSHHPETAAPLDGVTVPRWHRLVDDVLAAKRTMPMLHYIGWDVLQTEQGVKVIEGNNLPDLDLVQVHGGILGDPRVCRFYQHYGVLDGGDHAST